MRIRLVISWHFFALCLLLLTACGGGDQGSQQKDYASRADLNSIKQYLVNKSTTLTEQTSLLKQAGDSYYTLAKDNNFAYAQLVQSKRQDVLDVLTKARNAWIKASPTYEQMEGIVAGTPQLSQYDTNLDAGTTAQEGGDNVVTFDLTLPDGRKLEKPGNLFGVLESTLWGTDTNFIIKDVNFDFDGNGTKDFGDVLPDPNVLKSAADTMDTYANNLLKDAKGWTPTLSEAFSALIGNVPTVSDFFDSWKTSRFVEGDKAEHRDFAVISRLNDIVDNVTSWQTMYHGISPAAKLADSAQDTQITQGLANLKTYVENLANQEKNGKHFTPEDADILSTEAQQQANAINGKITQMAAKLNVRIAQQ